MKFYLGTHMPNWLWNENIDVPLFVSHTTLRKVKILKKSTREWALDSGAFSSIAKYGKHLLTPYQYAEHVARYQREIGLMEWAAPQDWMCEPPMLAKTGLSIEEHQARTVYNFLELKELWPDVSDLAFPFKPVLQGWRIHDFIACASHYYICGVDLEKYDVVGLGSVCRRQNTDEIAAIVREFTPIFNIHGFGIKRGGLAKIGKRLTSADSMAWSFDARTKPPLPGHHIWHKNCANCATYAVKWYWDLLNDLYLT